MTSGDIPEVKTSPKNLHRSGGKIHADLGTFRRKAPFECGPNIVDGREMRSAFDSTR